MKTEITQNLLMKDLIRGNFIGNSIHTCRHTVDTCFLCLLQNKSVSLCLIKQQM